MAERSYKALDAGRREQLLLERWKLDEALRRDAKSA
jgi:hypothetical protein